MSSHMHLTTILSEPRCTWQSGRHRSARQRGHCHCNSIVPT